MTRTRRLRPLPQRLADGRRPDTRARATCSSMSSPGPRRHRRRPGWLIPERWIPSAGDLGFGAGASARPAAHRHRRRAAHPGPGDRRGRVRRQPTPDLAGAVRTGGERVDRVHDGRRHRGTRRRARASSGRSSEARATTSPGPSRDDGSKLVFFRANGRRNVLTSGWPRWMRTAARRVGGPVWEPGWVDWSPTGDAVVRRFPRRRQAPMMTLVGRSMARDAISLIDVGMQAVEPAFRPSDGAADPVPRRGREWRSLGLYHRRPGRRATWSSSVSIRGPQAERVTASFFDGTFFNFSSWSPDGRRIAFESYCTDAGDDRRSRHSDPPRRHRPDRRRVGGDDVSRRSRDRGPSRARCGSRAATGSCTSAPKIRPDPLHFAMTRLEPRPDDHRRPRPEPQGPPPWHGLPGWDEAPVR